MLEYLITFICKKIKIEYKSVPIALIHILFIPIGLFLSTIPLGSYYRLKYVFVISAFFYIGYLFGQRQKTKRINILADIVLFILGIVICFINSDVSFSRYEFGNIVLMFASSICTICSLCDLTRLLTEKMKLRFLPFMGRNTIIIFYTHFIFIYVIRILEKLLHMPIHTFPPLLAFVIIIAIEAIMIKFMPASFKKLFRTIWK